MTFLEIPDPEHSQTFNRHPDCVMGEYMSSDCSIYEHYTTSSASDLKFYMI